MNATKIFNTEELPGRRLRSIAQFAVRDSRAGDLIVHSRHHLARQCAELIANEKDFFDVNVEQGYGSVRVDVVVMTEQELTDLMRMQFDAGVRHAFGYMPNHEQGGAA